jgi:hypothetical protein
MLGRLEFEASPVAVHRIGGDNGFAEGKVSAELVVVNWHNPPPESVPSIDLPLLLYAAAGP